jgi:hypothetical protein
MEIMNVDTNEIPVENREPSRRKGHKPTMNEKSPLEQMLERRIALLEICADLAINEVRMEEQMAGLKSRKKNAIEDLLAVQGEVNRMIEEAQKAESGPVKLVEAGARN